MKKQLPAIILTLIIIGFISIALLQDEAPLTPKLHYNCSKIITMSPSVTDTVWALTLGKKVIATDKFSSWPDAVKKLPKVGGFLDPNIEQIATLEPTIVIIPQSAGKTISSLEKLGIRILNVDHSTLKGVEKSFTTIASACGIPQQGETLLQTFKSKLAPSQSEHKPTILIVVSREMTDKGMKNIIGVGDDKLMAELITRAGGTNALKGLRPYSMIQREKLLTLQPDILVDVSLSSDSNETVLEAWKNSGIKSKIEVVNQQWAVVPGPRMVKLLELLKKNIKN
ncbi:ABC transporter substrate-binding protein [bacterium]|nr:ABC transporter substrate-binding protein [bacterium]